MLNITNKLHNQLSKKINAEINSQVNKQLYIQFHYDFYPKLVKQIHETLYIKILNLFTRHFISKS